MALSAEITYGVSGADNIEKNEKLNLTEKIKEKNNMEIITDATEKKAEHQIKQEAKLEKKEDKIDSSAISQEPIFQQQTPPPKKISSKIIESALKDTTENEADKVIRVKVALLDKLMDLAGELVLVRNQQMQIIDTIEDPRFSTITQQLNFVTSQLQENIMSTRMEPIGKVFNRFPRVVRDLSRELNKKINLEIIGQDVELDKNIIEAINDPLVHIIRNSLDHGIESPEKRKESGKSPEGSLVLKAYHSGGQVIIDVADDGAGINIARVKEKAIINGLVSLEEIEKLSEKDIMMFIMKAGFSTAESITSVSGRGVGMDVVKSTIEKLGGRVEIESQYKLGTTLRLKLPLTLAIVPCMITRVENFYFAIPQVNIVEIVWLYGKDVFQKIEKIYDSEVYRLRDTLLPLVRLSSILKIKKRFVDENNIEITDRRINTTDRRNKLTIINNELVNEDKRSGEEDRRNSIDNSLYIVVCKINQNRLGIIVDEAIDTEEIVVKSVHDEIKKTKCYAGATVLGDGKIALILDIPGLAETAKINFNLTETNEIKTEATTINELKNQTVLLFKNHSTEMFGVFLSLIARINTIKNSNIKRIGQQEYLVQNNESIPIIRIEKYIQVTPPEPKEDLFMILPKLNKKIGIVCSEIIDTISLNQEVNEDSFHQNGLMGSFVLNNIDLVMVIDIFKLIEMYSPEFFKKKTDSLVPISKQDLTVLLVEDTLFFLRAIENYLTGENFKVVTAENGVEALKVLETDKIDIIISDIEMPLMNGLDLITNIRKNEKLKNIPAVAVTSLNSEEIKKKVLKAGFNAYQEKLNKENLLSEINRIFSEIAQ